jgi:hypothetical protein
MNTLITPDIDASGESQPVLGHISAVPMTIELRMTPEEIREFVAKARAKDAEARERALAEKEKKD